MLRDMRFSPSASARRTAPVSGRVDTPDSAKPSGGTVSSTLPLPLAPQRAREGRLPHEPPEQSDIATRNALPPVNCADVPSARTRALELLLSALAGSQMDPILRTGLDWFVQETRSLPSVAQLHEALRDLRSRVDKLPSRVFFLESPDEPYELGEILRMMGKQALTWQADTQRTTERKLLAPQVEEILTESSRVPRDAGCRLEGGANGNAPPASWWHSTQHGEPRRATPRPPLTPSGELRIFSEAPVGASSRMPQASRRVAFTPGPVDSAGLVRSHCE